MLYNSSESKSESYEESEHGDIYVRNQFTRSDRGNCVGEKSYVGIVLMVKVDPDLYF